MAKIFYRNWECAKTAFPYLRDSLILIDRSSLQQRRQEGRLENAIHPSIACMHCHCFSPYSNAPVKHARCLFISPRIPTLSNHNPFVKPACHPRRGPLQIHILNPAPPIHTLPQQITKILPRDLALPSHFPLLLSLFGQLLFRSV